MQSLMKPDSLALSMSEIVRRFQIYALHSSNESFFQLWYSNCPSYRDYFLT